MNTDLILGTAGHIDHGKTSLIRALTGVDTDRLPEERKRGITIELGFAELLIEPYRLGIVDVPGHERFVRNMLAGATGMDLAMLVVAADDSVKPQTREHLEVLRLLDLPAGIIALTKCDLAEPDWVDLVEDEVRELVGGTFLADAPLVRTSVATGQGMDQLREALGAQAARAASSTRARRVDGPFRMAIDRTFSIAGHGTVVTGSVSSGRTAVGDVLVIEPGGIPARVRGLQNHDRSVDEIQRGQRAAINLAGVHHEQIGRGHELAAPGFLTPSRLLTVQLHLLESASKPLKNRQRVRVHIGTAELMASISLLDRQRVLPGESAPAQLFLRSPAVATWHQPLVVRSESPVTTIGGGQVLVPDAEKLRHVDEIALRFLADLQSTDQLERASAALYFSGVRQWHAQELTRTAGIIDVDGMRQKLSDRGDLVAIKVSPTRTISAHRSVLEQWADRIATAAEKLHRQNPRRSLIDRSRVTRQLAYLTDEAVIDAILESMQQAGRIRLTEKGIGLSGQGPQLTPSEQVLLQELVEQHREAGFQPPSVQQCQQRSGKHARHVGDLLALAEAEGALVEISAQFYLHAEAERELRRRLRDEMAAGKGLTVSQIREILDTTRKYAVPFCEYLDRIGFTRRQGDLRLLAVAETI